MDLQPAGFGLKERIALKGGIDHCYYLRKEELINGRKKTEAAA